MVGSRFEYKVLRLVRVSGLQGFYFFYLTNVSRFFVQGFWGSRKSGLLGFSGDFGLSGR